MGSRTTTKHYYDYTKANGEEIELELPCKPTESMGHYPDYLIYEKEGKILLGFLTDDQDVANPLEEDDYAGQIFTAHRNSKTHKEMQEALGLDSDWTPNLDLVEEEDIHKAVRKLLKDSANCEEGTSPTVYIQTLDYSQDNYGKYEDESNIDFVLRLLDNETETFDGIIDYEEVRVALWQDGRKNGTVGNRYAVLLDVYEHSQVRYSVSGGGPQCQWDTAKGGAVWVPKPDLIEHIQKLGQIYQKGKIIRAVTTNKLQYCIWTWAEPGKFDKLIHPAFDTWNEALDYLTQYDHKGYLQPLLDAEYQAAEELAAMNCDLYTDWCNGNCYGTAIVEYDEAGTEVEADQCGGYVGDDAYSTLKEEFDARKQSL